MLTQEKRASKNNEKQLTENNRKGAHKKTKKPQKHRKKTAKNNGKNGTRKKTISCKNFICKTVKKGLPKNGNLLVVENDVRQPDDLTGNIDMNIFWCIDYISQFSINIKSMCS